MERREIPKQAIPFDRQGFETQLSNHFALYVHRIGDLTFDQLVTPAVKNQLIQKVDTLSVNEPYPNKDTDGILVSQGFSIAVMKKLKNLDGTLKEGIEMQDVPGIIQSIAADFQVPKEDVPPTIPYAAAISQKSLEEGYTRPANILAFMIAKKFFEHPYFADLEDQGRKGLFHNLDVNITSPLLRMAGENTSNENLERIVDLFMERAVAEIDKTVVEYNLPERREEDESEATPVDVIQGNMVTDHDFLLIVAEKLYDSTK